MTTPAPDAVKAARGALTQAQAAALVHTTPRNWRRWEAGVVPMPLGSWELFRLKTGAVTLAELE